MASPTVSAQEVQSLLDYHFSNPQLLLEALKAAGAGFNSQHSTAARDGNKRLAQVGKVVMRTIVADDWYASNAERVIINERICKISSKDHLCNSARNAGLHGFIQTNPSHGMLPPSDTMIATSIEALLGAIWYDSGRDLQIVQGIMERLRLL